MIAGSASPTLGTAGQKNTSKALQKTHVKTPYLFIWRKYAASDQVAALSYVLNTRTCEKIVHRALPALYERAAPCIS